ncbi:MAG: N-6 DNA methylase, partial [Thermofilaceae archaeon]
LRLGVLKDAELQELAGVLKPRTTWKSLLEDLRSINDEARGLRIEYEFSQAVHDRYVRWIELQRRFEEGSGITEEGEEEQELQFNRKKRFARQCAYVFFLKLLLVRILEDKGIVKPRLISDGGLEAWVTTVRPRYTAQEERFAATHLLRMALERASGHYGEILQREVYDWFMPPSELSILDVLETLAAYNFSDLSTDLIGYTYQRFLERTERHRLGHYLTPPEVVDYILDEAGYLPDNRGIIGKKVLDPACGSGSFLVHAAYRYRQALAAFYHEQYKDCEEARLKLAQDFVHSIQEHFVGMDLNPFSCYLARINLLIQVLDDYHYLQSRGHEVVIEGFKIYNTDSLVDYPQGADLLEEINQHTVRHLKVKEAGQFGFVFANPPYITPKQENVGIATLRDNPFYESWLSGDINTYIFFIRVGLHFLSPHGRLAYIIPLTSLGDQQSEALRRKLLSLTKPLAITRFYTEHVLFKGVQQAVIVLVLEKDATEAKDALKVRVRGGGYGETPEVAIRDTRNRAILDIPFKNLSWWISKTNKPRCGLEVPNQRDNWENVWVIFPENECYYQLWEHMVKASSKTLYELFEELGLKPPENLISQGDVNTTHVKPFHVPADHPRAMPLYKGEIIELLMPLPYPPKRGPRGRSPFVAPNADNDLTGEQRRALAQLERISQLKQAESGLILHETANVRLWRRIKGTLFRRDEEFKPVFTHKLWVFRFSNIDWASATLGLLISTPFNFAYAALSTNNSIATRLLFCLPVPDQFDRVARQLQQHVENALKAGEKLQNVVKDFQGNLNIEASYLKGTIELDPITLLQSEQLASVKMEHYQQRDYIELSTENFKVQTLWERGNLRIKKESAYLRDVIQLWVKHYGDCRWSEFKERSVPDNPDSFWKKWTEKCEEAQNYLDNYCKAIAAIDETVADWYEIPHKLRYLLRERLPWTHGADRSEDNEE